VRESTPGLRLSPGVSRSPLNGLRTNAGTRQIKALFDVPSCQSHECATPQLEAPKRKSVGADIYEIGNLPLANTQVG
jgi:hypothetical protein